MANGDQADDGGIFIISRNLDKVVELDQVLFQSQLALLHLVYFIIMMTMMMTLKMVMMRSTFLHLSAITSIFSFFLSLTRSNWSWFQPLPLLYKIWSNVFLISGEMMSSSFIFSHRPEREMFAWKFTRPLLYWALYKNIFSPRLPVTSWIRLGYFTL